MIHDKQVLGLIPAKGRSTGLIGKNSRSLFGRPLFTWPVRVAQDSIYIDQVVVSTDSSYIKRIAEGLGAHVVMRPYELTTDESTSFSVIQHALSCLQTFDYLVFLEPTSPLTESADIDEALRRLDANRDKADSVVSVTKVGNAHPDYCAPISENGLLGVLQHKRRQDLTKLFRLDGSFYISTTQAVLENQGFYHERTLPFIMPKYKSFEIDDEIDFVCVEAMLLHLEKFKPIMRSIFD